MKRFEVEVEYTVTELIEVEADDVTEAEDKALEMLKLGVTDRNIVGDTCDEADVVRSGEATHEK